jgi:hypothetical protein
MAVRGCGRFAAMTRRLTLLLIVLLVPLTLAVGGCETAPPQAQRQPQLRFDHLAPIRLDVAVVEVVNKYKAPLRAPNVEHRFPTPPDKVLRQWAEDRLVAAGASGSATFVIRDASVKETELPTKKGLKGLFYKEQAQRYDATFDVLLRIADANGREVGYVTARAERSRSVPEDISLNERERAWFVLTEKTVNDLGAELEDNIRNTLGRFLVP